MLLADGPSDLPLASHIEALCADLGVNIVVTAVDPRLTDRRSRTVEDRMRFVFEQGDGFDIAFIHRDAEAKTPATRRDEIVRSATSVGIDIPVVPIVPVRMTEAWLLLDPAGIRAVAGRPRDATPLDLPKAKNAERIADPKTLLAEALLKASGTTGRRRVNFQRDFPKHRALLLERLDPRGPVCELPSWRQLLHELRQVTAELASD